MPTSLPAGLAPVTQARIEKPMSATVGMYVAAVAPAIGTHVDRSPNGLHRRHEYVKVGAGDPSHVPAVSASGLSTTGCEVVICGVTRSTGAMALTAGVASEFCPTEPAEFVAVTWTRSSLP